MRHPVLLRRTLLQGALFPVCFSFCSSAFAASAFWNRKPPSEWSADEIEKMKTSSPWARTVPLDLKGMRNGKSSTMDSAGSRGTFGGMHGADSNGLSLSRGRGNGGAGVPGNAGPPVTVRWESAPPVLDATRLTLPPAFRDSYAVSVTGLPPAVLMMGARAGENLPDDPAARQRAGVERLLAATTLTAKGREPQKAAFVVQSNDLTSLIFGFGKTQPFSLDDHELVFHMQLGGAAVHAKFEPKEMMWNGKLAL